MVAAFREQRDLALENLALRQQLGVLKRKVGLRLKRRDLWLRPLSRKKAQETQKNNDT